MTVVAVGVRIPLRAPNLFAAGPVWDLAVVKVGEKGGTAVPLQATTNMSELVVRMQALRTNRSPYITVALRRSLNSGHRMAHHFCSLFLAAREVVAAEGAPRTQVQVAAGAAVLF